MTPVVRPEKWHPVLFAATCTAAAVAGALVGAIGAVVDVMVRPGRRSLRAEPSAAELLDGYTATRYPLEDCGGRWGLAWPDEDD